MPAGRDLVLEVLRTEGVHHVFGNPGTTELPLIDALVDAADFTYVLGLQEATVVAMADGYAQATGRPAFVNLHTSVGLGNALGNLVNAATNRTPLVVTAGQQDQRHLIQEPLLSGDLIGIAEPVSKWTHEVRSVDELGTTLRRAFKDAATPPSGTVFVSIPMNVLDDESATAAPERSEIDPSVVPARISELTELLVSTRPGELAIVFGDEVTRDRAGDLAVAVAEKLQAPVFAPPLHGSAVFPPEHPLFAGFLEATASELRARLGSFTRVLVLGAPVFVVSTYTDGPVLDPDVELLHVSADASLVGRHLPTRLGLVGSARATLMALNEEIDKRVARSAGEPSAHAALAWHVKVDELDRQAVAGAADKSLHPMVAVHAALRAMPDDAAVVEEAITARPFIRPLHGGAYPERYYFPREAGLGWAMPASVGVALGRSGPVLAFIGDGAAMYSPQALWTAARFGVPVVFVVLVNRQYLILKRLLRASGSVNAAEERFVGMDLDNPMIDYVALARAMGVDGSRVTRADELSDAVATAFAVGKPHVIEVALDPQ